MLITITISKKSKKKLKCGKYVYFWWKNLKHNLKWISFYFYVNKNLKWNENRKIQKKKQYQSGTNFNSNF